MRQASARLKIGCNGVGVNTPSTVLWRNRATFIPICNLAMWNISSKDVEQAKESIRLRRAAAEARYEDETRALDAEFAAVETLERAASEFALSHQLDQVQAAPDDHVPAEADISDGSEEKIPSRWRLHLGSRPSDADGAIGNIQSTR